MSTRLELSDDAMQAALAFAEQGAVAATIVTVFDAFGVDLTEPDGPRVRLADYAIPAEQWTELATALMKAADSGLAGANVCLDWVNLGPSSYDPAEVEA